MRREEKKFDFTVVEGFEMVIAKLQKIQGAETEIAFIQDRIEKQMKKATSSKRAEKVENAEILNLVIEELAKGEKTIGELLKTDALANYTYQEKDEMKNISSSKLSAILQKEIYAKNEEAEKVVNVNSRIERVENGKKITFKLK